MLLEFGVIRAGIYIVLNRVQVFPLNMLVLSITDFTFQERMVTPTSIAGIFIYNKT